MRDKPLPLTELWNNFYVQIETASQSFWQQTPYQDHGRIQNPTIWSLLQTKLQELLSVLFADVPLTPFETFLLKAATHLYESGWQVPGAPEATVAQRYVLSGELIRYSFLQQQNVANLGLTQMDPTTVEMLARLCSAVGLEDLSDLSLAPEPGGYQETVRLRYLVALLQIADALLVPRQKQAYFRGLTRFREEDESRLALHPYIASFALNTDCLTTHMRINPEDSDLEEKMIARAKEPIQRWLTANWRWLKRELRVDIILKTALTDYRSIPPEPLRTTCKALRLYLTTYQPPVLALPQTIKTRASADPLVDRQLDMIIHQGFAHGSSSMEDAAIIDLTSPPQQLRHLQAKLPARVRVRERIPIQARVARESASGHDALLRFFPIPAEGIDVQLVLECPGFLIHSASLMRVRVQPTSDSDWVLFEIEALHEGISILELSAFTGGTFLGTLSFQLTVDNKVRRPNTDSVVYNSILSLRSAEDGEATLVIHYDPISNVYRYRFRSAAYVETDEICSGPLRRKQEDAIADLVALLNAQARDLSGYSAEETRRWLQGKGMELWRELIPPELEKVFWKHRDQIKWMTILSAGDPMPWELLYPTNDAGDETGFLAEQFPIVRWLFGSIATTRLFGAHPSFIIPEDAPSMAEEELAELQKIVGKGPQVSDLTPLLRLLDTATFDILHFACHNLFRPDSPMSSSILMGDKRFVPTFLSKYKGRFRHNSPLVFLNACRTDGMAANYTWLAGWAKSFLDAGAGAFLGSLWEVRDGTASRFAKEFYRSFFAGEMLGKALMQARAAIQNEPGDPTWLAYTLYGNPTAVLVRE